MVGENPKKNQLEMFVFERPALTAIMGNNEIYLPVCNSYGFHWMSVVFVQGFRLVSSQKRNNYEF